MALLSKYGYAVPRYTSYPTAPHFSDQIGNTHHQQWVSELAGSQKPVSVYIHVPFCQTLCWYCGCTTQVVNSKKPIVKYGEILLDEITLLKKFLNQHVDQKIYMNHLHWGGGTPTALPAELMADIMAALYDIFTPSEGIEANVEIDPRTISEDQIRILPEKGINRASIGIQDFDPVVQKAINRVQSFEVTDSVVAQLRSQGVSSINFDLVYGLPHQTVKSIQRTIDLCMRMEPDRLSLFGYAHVPWMKSHQKLIDQADLPDAEARFEQRAFAHHLLEARGYVPIGLDHFAKPSDKMAIQYQARRLHRNFQGYTTDTAPNLIGLGASAISAFSQGYSQATTSTREYMQDIQSGKLSIEKGVILKEEDRFRRSLINHLMCYQDILFPFTCPETGRGINFRNLESVIVDPLLFSELKKDHLIQVTEAGLTITEIGKPFLRTIASLFDHYYGQRFMNQPIEKHSIAV